MTLGLRERPTAVVDVRSFGAAGDGVTDDSAVIQSAIDSVSAAGGGVVRIAPPGNYVLENVSVKSGVTLDLTGARVLHRAGSGGLPALRTDDASVNARIVGGTINGNQPNMGAIANTIEMGGTRPKVIGTAIYDSAYAAVKVRNATSHATVEGVDIYKVSASYAAEFHGVGIGDGTNVSMPDHTLVTGCHVRHTRYSGVGVDGATWTSVVGNVFDAPGSDTFGDGVAAYTQYNDHTLIEANTVNDPGNHFVHAGGNNVTLVGNHGYNAATEGYVVASSPNSDPTASVGAHVEGNTARFTDTLGGAQGAMVRVERYEDVVIGGGLIRAANLSGINVVDCQQVAIYPGLIKGCLSHGIRLAGCVDVAINGGVVASCGGNGVSIGKHTRVDATVVECDNIAINGTVVRSNTGWGVIAADATLRVMVSAFVRGNTAGNVSLTVNRTSHVVAPATFTTPTLASAATLTLSPDVSYFNVTGTTGITSITTSWPGRVITLRFAGILTVTDGSNLKLNGNCVTAADSVLTLVCDGTNWYEMARSVN